MAARKPSAHTSSARSEPGKGETRLIEWLQSQPETGGLIGDDAAILPAGGPYVATVDSQRSAVHLPSDLPPAWAARRLVAVNLSDLAAMGARPRWAFCTLGAERGYPRRAFLRALLREAKRHDFTLAGGDLSSAPGLQATLLFLGERVSRGRFLERRSAQPGDEIWIGGTLGEAALGLALLERGAHIDGARLVLPPGFERSLERVGRSALRRQLAPQPQLELGAWLARRRSRTAAIDVSDGFACDLHALCAASGVGAEISYERLPAPPRLGALAAAVEANARDAILAGGEDYVLLFTRPHGSARPPMAGCRRIGLITRRETVVLSDGQTSRPLPALGFDHLP